jgi:hypothetical protein
VVRSGVLGLLALAILFSAPAQAQTSRAQAVEGAQRPRIIIYPRTPQRSAKRHCRSWLVQEYRVSGPVIVPRMRCWWE